MGLICYGDINNSLYLSKFEKEKSLTSMISNVKSEVNDFGCFIRQLLTKTNRLTSIRKTVPDHDDLAFYRGRVTLPFTIIW